MAERSRPTGPWGDRVRFAPGGFAYVPDVVVVPVAQAELADRAFARLRGDQREAAYAERTELLGGAFVGFRGVDDVLRTTSYLRDAGVQAQPDHIVFATCCCPPHPASPKGAELYASPFYANMMSANPFYANPFYANPFYANAGGGCCGCGSGGSSANPFYANPFYANPFYANPFYANAQPNPARSGAAQETGRRRTSARPTAGPNAKSDTQSASGGTEVRIAILDTGWAQSHAPSGLPSMSITDHGGDHPDEDGDQFLDPAAGHGTFIAGVIEQTAPGCSLELFAPLTSYGDGSETAIAGVLLDLAQRPDDERPHFVNLSFGGYSPIGMAVLAYAITELRALGVVVVASAGNDATCTPIYPAALPGVVSVGAVDEDGNAAPFTNYGAWVRACTLGLDVVSTFFEGFDGAEPEDSQGRDEDEFHGWAVWSGTSFAAPRVVAALAREVQNGRTPDDAVAELIDGPNQTRKPMLGTYVP